MKATTLTLVTLLTLSGCGACNDVVPDALKPESRAVAIPLGADMVAGSRHDLLIVACVDRISWADVLTPFVVTAFFVSMGRLDAAFYLPGAVASSLIPDCRDAEFEVTNARVEGAGFSLVPTENPAAFHIDAGPSGEGVFRADVTVRGEVIPVEATFRAHEPNEVSSPFECPRGEIEGYTLDASLHELGTSLSFDDTVAIDGLELGGYGFDVFEPSETIELTTDDRGVVFGEFVGPPGPASLRSAYDPSFQFDAMVFERSEYNQIEMFGVGHAVSFVGSSVAFFSMVSRDGVIPCTETFLSMTLETPTTCDISAPFRRDSTSVGPRGASGVGPGLCRIRVDLEEAGLSATYEKMVYPGFEAVEVPNRGEALLGQVIGHGGQYFAAAVDRMGEELRVDWENIILYSVDGEWRRQVVDSEVWELDAAGGHVFARTVGKLTSNDPESLGSIWEFDGAAWTEHQMPGELQFSMASISAVGADDVWAVGGASAYHYDGSVWSKLDAPPDERFVDVWAGQAEQAYVLGTTLYRIDGDVWTDILADADPDLLVDSPKIVTGTATGELWLSGGRLDDRLLHFDGEAWSVVEIGGEDRRNFPKYSSLWPVPGTDDLFLYNAGTAWVAHWDGEHLLEFDRPFGVGGGAPFTVDGDTIYLTGSQQIYELTHVP